MIRVLQCKREGEAQADFSTSVWDTFKYRLQPPHPIYSISLTIARLFLFGSSVRWQRSIIILSIFGWYVHLSTIEGERGGTRTRYPICAYLAAKAQPERWTNVLEKLICALQMSLRACLCRSLLTTAVQLYAQGGTRVFRRSNNDPF